jgi:hypothetical protein
MESVMRYMKMLLVPFSALSGLMVAQGAFAQATPIDVTAVTAQIASATTPIGLIGGGVLLVVVAIATYKWVRRAF